MIKLHIIQARYGDCLLLEYGEEYAPAFMLIDGGPARNYQERLKPSLLTLLNGRTILDDIVISHVDNDHIMGVLDLLTELQFQQDTGETPFLKAANLWFNSFNNTIGTTDIEKRMGKINQVASLNGLRMQEMSLALNGIKEGSRVILRANKLGIALNKDMPGGFFLASGNNPVIRRKNTEILITGPTADNLAKLRAEWEEWIRKNEQQIAAGKYTRDVAAALDRSIPNLSSIVMLVKADGKTILLTGDCRSDHLQQGLIETGISPDGNLHVDVLKVPHHGSCRNIKGPEFFEQVTADTYIISADGTYDNPDDTTLAWIVDAAKKSGRKVKLVLTNETASSSKLLQEYEPAAYHYDPVFIKKEENYLTIIL